MLVKPIFDLINYVKEDKKAQLVILSIVIFCIVYNLCFRYEYKVYKGKAPYTVEMIKIDKLTGKYRYRVIKPENMIKKRTKVVEDGSSLSKYMAKHNIWSEVEEIKTEDDK